MEIVSGKDSCVLFVGRPEGQGTRGRLLDLLSFRERSAARNRRPCINGALAVGAAALAGRQLHARARGIGRLS